MRCCLGKLDSNHVAWKPAYSHCPCYWHSESIRSSSFIIVPVLDTLTFYEQDGSTTSALEQLVKEKMASLCTVTVCADGGALLALWASGIRSEPPRWCVVLNVHLAAWCWIISEFHFHHLTRQILYALQNNANNSKSLLLARLEWRLVYTVWEKWARKVSSQQSGTLCGWWTSGRIV